MPGREEWTTPRQRFIKISPGRHDERKIPALRNGKTSSQGQFQFLSTVCSDAWTCPAALCPYVFDPVCAGCMLCVLHTGACSGVCISVCAYEGPRQGVLLLLIALKQGLSGLACCCLGMLTNQRAPRIHLFLSSPPGPPPPPPPPVLGSFFTWVVGI